MFDDAKSPEDRAYRKWLVSRSQAATYGYHQDAFLAGFAAGRGAPAQHPVVVELAPGVVNYRHRPCSIGGGMIYPDSVDYNPPKG